MPRCATALALLLASSLSLAAAPTRASDGYEVALPMAGGLIGVVALDVTFTVATATGLTYHDDAWATLEVIWGSLSLVASGIGIGWAIDQGIDGLAGALALQGIGSAIQLAYGLVGLESGETEADLRVALVPSREGFTLCATGAF